jgi:hypothetical protein
MMTHDAQVTDASGCQIKTWFRVEPDSPRTNEFRVLPACNPLGNLVLP